MEYKCSVLHPDKAEAIPMGRLSDAEVLNLFDKFDWSAQLAKMKNLSDDEIHYSPSLKIEDLKNDKWVELSAVGEPTDYIYYVFYKRRKEVKKFFGLSKKMDDDYTSEILDVSVEKTRQIINDFLNRKWDQLETMF